MRNHTRHRHGFTLIEILVTVAIIALLIAILIPSLAAARNAAKKAATLAQMSQIQKACIAYESDFNAYPGPIAEESWGAGVTGYSDSQNMLLGLSLRWYSTGQASSTSTPIPGANIAAESTTNLTPISYSNYGKTGSCPTYFPFKQTDISTGDPGADSARWSTTNLAAFPVIMDRQAFGSSAMPILYYRLASKWDPDKINNSGVAARGYAFVPAGGNAGGNPAQNPACFYNDANSVFTANVPSGISTSNAPVAGWGNQFFAQGTNANALWNLTDRNRSNLNNIALSLNNGTQWAGLPQPNPNPNTYKPRGGFVLISAGVDRIYGPDVNGNSDDLILSDE